MNRVYEDLQPRFCGIEPRCGPFRTGDARHVKADLEQATAVLGDARCAGHGDGLARIVVPFVQARGPALT